MKDQAEWQRLALLATLEVAVPLWQRHWRPFGHAARLRRACDVSAVDCGRSGRCGPHSLAAMVACHGDSLQFGGRDGLAAKAFNALAEGLSLASYHHGGLWFMGRAWQAPFAWRDLDDLDPWEIEHGRNWEWGAA